jgi:hypothetical protein
MPGPTGQRLDFSGLTFGRGEQLVGGLLSDFGRQRHSSGRIVDAADEHAQLFDRVVDRVRDGTGDVLGDRRRDRQIAVGEVAEFVHQAQDRVLILAVDRLGFTPALLGLFGLTLTLRQVGSGEQNDQCNRQSDQHQQHDAIGGPVHATALVRLRELHW